MLRRALLPLSVVVLAAACSGPPATPTVAPEATPTAMPDPATVPAVDTSLRTVPLEDVVFDTFQGGFVRLPEAAEALIERLRDLIRPVYEPQYELADQVGSWLRSSDLIIGIEAGSQAYAYPVKTLTFREIVNDVIDGAPVLVTYCPLCASGVVYSRELNGRTLLFGNTSALYESDLVMYDHQTGSYWHQVSGEAIVGDLAGEQLRPLPSLMATFGQWRSLHPESLVLANSKAQAAQAIDPMRQIQNSANAGFFSFPVIKGRADDRLRLGDHVLVLRAGGQWKGYALSVGSDGAANDVVGGVPLIVFSQELTAAAYLSTVDGRTLSFTLRESSGDDEAPLYRDEQTGSTWDMAGRAVAGPLAGSWLGAVPSRRGFWFSIAGAYSGIELYR